MAQMVKTLPAMQVTWVQSLGWEDTLEKGEWQPTPAFLPGESHEQRSLAGHSPLGCRVRDDWVTNIFTFSKKDDKALKDKAPWDPDKDTNQIKGVDTSR